MQRRSQNGCIATSRVVSADGQCGAGKRDHMLATFEDLQDAAQGVKRLGVLRMDVTTWAICSAKGSSASTREHRVACDAFARGQP